MNEHPHDPARGAARSAPVDSAAVSYESLRQAADAGVLYAVIDACDTPGVPERVLSLGHGRGTCLYRGSAAENFGDKAPYLARADRELLEWIDDSLCGQPWGVFLISHAGFSTLNFHLRKFITVTSPDGEAMLLRYYDPRILPLFLSACDAAEAREFFGECESFVTFRDAPGAPEAEGRALRLSDAARADETPIARRPVGENFPLRDEHIAVFRRKNFGDEIIKTFHGTKQVARRDAGSSDILIADQRNRETRMSFDRRGFIGGVTSPLDRSWRIENDAQGKPLAITLPSGSRTLLTYDALGRPASTSRDDRLLSTITHDPHGRLERIDYPDDTRLAISYRDTGDDGARDPRGKFITTITDRLNRADTFAYTNEDDLVTLTDGNGNTTGFEYDEWQLPSRTRHPDGSREAYSYNPNGALVRIADAAGDRLELIRDDADRIITMRGADGGEAHFAYDDQGRVTEARNAEITVKYEYDSEGRVTKEDQGGAIVGYTYDDDGLLGAIIYPTGETIAFTRDADLRLSAVTDWAGRAYRFDYAEDDRGWTLTTPDNLSMVARQSLANHLTALDVRRTDAASAPAAILARTEFAYDGEDRIIASRDARLGEKQFAYDAEGQILSSIAPARRESFAYDAAGNRTTQNGESATFNALNQLTAQGSARLVYDERGNLAQRIDGSRGWSYAYDSHNRLTSAEDDQGNRLTFGYDAFGRRIWTKHVATGNGTTDSTHTLTRFIWAGEQLIREATETSGTKSATHSHAAMDVPTAAARSTQDYLYIPATFTPLLTRTSEERIDSPGSLQGSRTYLYQTDHLGTPHRLFDERGVIVWEADYAAFGAARLTINRVAQPLRFAGQYADPETGLHYNRFRYYAPDLGRYITRDPVSYLGGLNLYRYCGNNPTNDADPLGLWSWKTVAAVAGGIVAGVAVAALIVVTAPVSVPALLVAGVATVAAGVVGGAVYGGLNEGLENGFGCLSCVAAAAGKGALVGGIAALPFAFLPATAGVAAFMGVGALSGAIGYTADWALNGADPNQWSWKGFATATGIGAATAGLGRYLGPKIGNWWRGGRQPQTRPSWRQSEIDVGNRLRRQGFNTNQSASFRNGQQVPYGTRGSTRPEYYKPGTSVEVKNYNVQTPRGRRALINNVTTQSQHRAANLPPGTTQRVYVDVRGQNVSRQELRQLTNDIVAGSNGTLRARDITILR